LLNSKIDIADGSINVSEFRALGSAFMASSQGTITISPVLTNSMIRDLPVQLALGRNLAARAGFRNVSGTNNPYVEIGTVARISGTVGNPQTKVDYARIAVLTGEQLIGGTAGEVLRGIGGASSGTNASVGNVIQSLGGLLGSRTANPGTNSSAVTNQPATTNQAPLSEILKLLGPRKK
jgi:hypothetical protein